MTEKPGLKSIFALLCSVICIVIGSKMYDAYRREGSIFGSWSGERLFVEVSVVGLRPAYNGCDVIIQFRNTNSKRAPNVSLQASAFDVHGVERALAVASIRDLGVGGAEKSKFYFPDVGCGEIRSVKIEDNSLVVTVSSDSKLMIAH